jgi:hypothetical protein
MLSSGGPLPRLRGKLRDLSECLRYEDAARLRDRISALEQVVEDLAELERLRAARLCLVAPAVEPGFRRAFFVSGGRVAAVRILPRGPAARIELEAGLAEARAGEESVAPEDAVELLLIGSFLRRPPPELEVVRMVDLERGYLLGDGRAAAGAGDPR